MVKRCIAGGGSNTMTAAVSLHYFPEAKRIRAAWSLVVSHSAVFSVTLDLHCMSSLQSSPLRSPEELQEPYADHTIKASDKCGNKSKATHSAEVKLLHFAFYASG
ncbi:hypothetical protein CRENBAI_003272 [Crenichthys baileyi]|uniref:Uncharacterized protein n=1 Tax=Crenichthys baileyi TaxID=28760 RepID=A0AAV9RSL0_9TELE